MEEILGSSSPECSCGMNIEDAENIEMPLKFVLVKCVSIGINLFGLIANSIAINVLFKHDFKSIFNKTLFILAIFDIVFNACDILETIRLTHYDNGSCLPMPFYRTIHLYLTPQFVRPLRVFASITSMYTTVAIALERYLAVSKPITTFVARDENNWKPVFLIVGPIIVFSFILTLPLSFEFFIDPQCTLCVKDREVRELSVEKCDNSKLIPVSIANDTKYCINMNVPDNSNVQSSTNDTCYVCTIPKMQWKDIRLDKTYSLLYRTFILNISTYVIPLILLFVFNWLIYKHLKKRKQIIKNLGKDIWNSVWYFKKQNNNTFLNEIYNNCNNNYL